MYDISPAWMEYYQELEPEMREKILKRLLEEEPDDGSNRFRELLFSKRYLKDGEVKPSVDRLLWQCVNFSQIYGMPFLFRNSGKKEVRRFLSENGYDEARAAGPDGERALYWEIRNAAKRYFKTCSGTEYRRVFFGLLNPGTEDQKEQMCSDTWKMTKGIGKRLGLSDILDLWTKAVLDEYRLTDPSAEERMSRLHPDMAAGNK